MSLHDTLKDVSERLALISADLSDNQESDGDYDERTFDTAVSEVTGISIQLLNAVGDHDAAEAAERAADA